MSGPGFPADFEAEIVFVADDDGRARPAVQGDRPDMRYQTYEPDTAWMIWPRFLDGNGRELPDGARVPPVARAHMFIPNRDLRRDVHRGRIDIGTDFELVEGKRTVATGRVTAILALRKDP